MSREGVVALAAERVEVLRLYRSLTPDEWTAPSGCAGWSCQDVLAHLASLFHPTPSLVTSLRGDDIEHLNDTLVEQRRSWSPQEQLAEYETWSRRALHVLGALQRRPLAAIPVPLADLGTHPVSRLADASVFDHYTHLRFDLVAPRGPVDRPTPPADPLRLRPVVSWMTTLVPICSEPALAELDAWVALRLEGPGGGTWYLGPSAPAPGSPGRTARRARVAREAPGAIAATITSTTAVFPGWATRRTAWRDEGVELSGDRDLAERAADALFVF